MSALLSLQVLLFAGEAFAASSLIVMLAWLAAARRTASQRHLVWASAFGALIALPALAAIVPAQIRLSLAAPVMPVTQGFDTVSVASLPGPSGFSIDASTIVFALIALWLIGVAAIAARGLIAAFALRRLRKQSVAHRFGHLPIAGPRCALRLATDASGPMTWGILRPIILLPEDADCWPRARLEAVLLHELAHIRRYDALTQFLALIVCAFYWPNPLVWLGASRLRREAETAADDAVLEAGVKPSAYAGELLQIASEFRVQRLSLPLAMAAPSALEARVKSVLEPNQSRSGVTSMDVFKIACLGMMATTAIAFARPSLAQDAPQGPAVTATPLPAATPAPDAQPDTRAMNDADNPSQKVVRDTTIYGEPGKSNIYRVKPGDGVSEIMSDDASYNPKTHIYVYSGKHVTVRGNDIELRSMNDLSPAERARMRAAIAQAQTSIRDIKPTIDRAMREARVQLEHAHVSQEQVRVAMVRAQKAIADVHIDRTVANALKNAHIDATVAKALKDEHIDKSVSIALAKAQRDLEEAERDHAAVVIDDGEADAPPPPPAPPAPVPPAPAELPAPPAPAMPPAPPPAPQ